MGRFSFSDLFGSARRQRRAEIIGQLDAINRAQAVIEFDLEGHVLAANQNFLDTMGYALNEIVGAHHGLFVTDGERASTTYRDFWHRLGEGEYDAGRYLRVAKDGREVWLQATYNPVLDRTGAPIKVVKYATDITHQEKRDADVRGQLEAIGKVQAIIEFELDGTVIWANDLFLRSLGYTLDEVVGRHHSMFVQPEDRQSPPYKQFWEKLAMGRNDAGQYLRIGKNGRQVWIEASYNPIFDAMGRPFKVVKYATDITRRFTAAQALRGAVVGLTENADRASQADLLAREACGVAEQGGHTVDDVVRAMRAITSNSRRISEIVGVVDTIAFQTNILALNAAVEAARAGAHGKGFAVVATEVRNLAQSSASAAREIKSLIATSVSEIDRGAGLVQTAGTTMQDILTSSRRVTEIMAEVVAVSLAQSHTLGDVTHDITESTLKLTNTTPTLDDVRLHSPPPARHSAMSASRASLH